MEAEGCYNGHTLPKPGRQQEQRVSLSLLHRYLVKLVLAQTTQCRLVDEELVRIWKEFTMCQLTYYRTFGKPG